MNLSPHFTLAELTISQEATRSGLSNTPNALQTEALALLCTNILEPLRARVRKPIIVSSGFRSVSVNRRIGGSSTSQHTKGQAADFTIPGMTVSEVVSLILKMGFPVDQLINEGNAWVHVSYSDKHRRQVLLATFKNGKAEYKVLA